MRRILFFCIIFLFLKTNIYGIIVGNPSDPCLYLNGLFSCNKKNYSLRASFLYNHVYKGRFVEKFRPFESTPSDIQYTLLASVLTLNLFNRLDLYGILGTSNLQIDQMIYTNRRFAWAAGLKAILLQIRCFDLSFDGKYFSTNQKPEYLVVEKDVYPLISSFEEKLEEYQASLALSYKTKLLIPYIGSTFLYSTITPTPKIGIISIPGAGESFFETSDSITQKKWGMVVGISIINHKKQATLNLETRFFDQNAFAFVGTLRF